MSRSFKLWAESLDPTRLPSVSFDKREEVPRVSGIYFFLSGPSRTPEVSSASQSLTGWCVLYIGVSETDIVARWRHGSHTPSVLLNRKQKEIQQQVRIFWLEEDANNVIPLETALIQRFEPPLNNRPLDIHLGKHLNRILGIDENDGLVNNDLSADALTTRIRENADRRGEQIRKCTEAPDGVRDSPFGLSARSEARNNAFRIVYALSIDDYQGEETKCRFPKVMSLREKIAGLDGSEIGSGYRGKDQVMKIAYDIGLSKVRWQTHAFAETSTRFAVFKQENGKFKLYTEGSVWERK